MYAVIYQKLFKQLPTEPPTTTASASNEGQIFSGTNNSLWQSTKESKSIVTRKWVEITVPAAIPPSRSATSSDVGVEVTASDGSIWKGMRSGGWDRTWQYSGSTTNESLTVVTEGVSCAVVGAKGRGNRGLSDPGNPDIKYYTEYTCEGSQATYSWQLVRIRKTCGTCPPTTQTFLGDQCSCADAVYELKDVPEIRTTYYWKKIKDEATLTLEANELVRDITIDLTRRTYDADTGSIEGFLETDIEDPFIFEIKDDQDKSIYSGFIKNWKWADGTARFNIEDFRVVLDTDIILDYSHGDNDFRLSMVYEKVADQVKSSAGSFLYDFIIPTDLIDTVAIADYSNQYIIVNALRFLKTYLSYHNYIIDKVFDYNQNKVVFTFRKQISDSVEIRLEDFVHEKTKTDIKTNRVVATIQFKTIYDVDSEWMQTDEIAFITAPTEKKSSLYGNDLPPLDGYDADHVLRLLKNPYFKVITQAQYNELPNRQTASIILTSGTTVYGEFYSVDKQDVQQDTIISINLFNNPLAPLYEPGNVCSLEPDAALFLYYSNPYRPNEPVEWSYMKCDGYVQYPCPINAPTLAQVNSNFNVMNYEYGTGLRIVFQDSNGQACANPIYVQTQSDNIEYWTKGGTLIIPRPETLASKTYSLGLDNNIYEGVPPSELMIYPIKTEMFEAETLAKAQVDAIYSLVNNRWNENIIIDSTLAPAEVHKLELLQLVRVYDKNGDSKLLPVSEITVKHSLNRTYKVKLGFKKELFTQIYKSDTSQGVLK